VSKLDLAEFKSRDHGVTLGRRTVGYRLELAGFEPAAVRVAGRRPRHRHPGPPGRHPRGGGRGRARGGAAPGARGGGRAGQPVVVKLPEVPTGERVTFTAKPRGKASGRVQVDMTIACGGETLLALAVHLDVKDGARPDARVVPAGGAAPAPPRCW
jgi:hypothetical protein